MRSTSSASSLISSSFGDIATMVNNSIVSTLIAMMRGSRKAVGDAPEGTGMPGSTRTRSAAIPV
jgi:hypothetical protein